MSRTGLITYPEFELALDLLFPNILIHYAKTTKIESPIETPRVTNYNESFSKKTSILAKSKLLPQPLSQQQPVPTKDEDLSRFTKFFFKRLDQDRDNLLSIEDFSILY